MEAGKGIQHQLLVRSCSTVAGAVGPRHPNRDPERRSRPQQGGIQRPPCTSIVSRLMTSPCKPGQERTPRGAVLGERQRLGGLRLAVTQERRELHQIDAVLAVVVVEVAAAPCHSTVAGGRIGHGLGRFRPLAKCVVTHLLCATRALLRTRADLEPQVEASPVGIAVTTRRRCFPCRVSSRAEQSVPTSGRVDSTIA